MQPSQLVINIIDLANDDSVRQVSRLLTDVSSDLAVSRGGHVPDDVVSNIIHTQYTTVEAVQQTFAETGVRFAAFDKDGRMVGTLLVSKQPNFILARDSNRLNFTCDGEEFPANLHSTFNLAVRPEHRRRGIARLLFETVTKDYRHLFGGHGLLSRAEPTEHECYARLGFQHVPQYDVFFEPGVELPPGFATVQDFNEYYSCACTKEPRRSEKIKTHKLKYMIFTKPFALA